MVLIGRDLLIFCADVLCCIHRRLHRGFIQCRQMGVGIFQMGEALPVECTIQIVFLFRAGEV